ncbi:putative reverse transcriptase domain-containing protein [Tanacetum coccineum]|uniref:Reverse transcriptase domain-containing protein n=1 Tax=Tanacetum coccineum TaxID=301880 RepID=A0ABQ5B1Y5_9ASTR
MDEANKSKYFVHPGADKMYYDLRDRYWCPGMKKDIAEYVSEFALSTLDVLQRFGFYLQMGFTIILATLDGLDMGLFEMSWW